MGGLRGGGVRDFLGKGCGAVGVSDSSNGKGTVVSISIMWRRCFWGGEATPPTLPPTPRETQ